ncbi:amphi-Trp domain-containing protein [Natrialba sp. PRR66]|uniref:amphi-Trp domain-containing protein n=1 Tax=Natrialba sp. PRR66 TaxID=3098146 RepID=UPI002B1DFD23|nr:amphi-Trp domain-containing protein [Natrialba sp. PRR66]
MADTTTYEDETSREAAADRLRAIAAELESGPTADIQVGNKLLALSPGEPLEYAIEVEERSPMLGGEREAVTVTLGWEEATREEQDADRSQGQGHDHGRDQDVGHEPTQNDRSGESETQSEQDDSLL